MYSFWLPHTGLFQPCLLGSKQLHSKRAELAPKLVLYFTHRNGPIFDLFDLQCNVGIMITNVQLLSSLKRWFQFHSRILRTKFASLMTWNNQEMIAETRSLHFQTLSQLSTSCLLKQTYYVHITKCLPDTKHQQNPHQTTPHKIPGLKGYHITPNNSMLPS